jgi:hypothetical protein
VDVTPKPAVPPECPHRKLGVDGTLTWSDEDRAGQPGHVRPVRKRRIGECPVDVTDEVDHRPSVQ